MRQRILCLLASRKSDLKNEWAKRLRAEPVRSALGEPAVLEYLMDETLDQLANLLTRQPVRRFKAGRDAFANRCRCGLNRCSRITRPGRKH